MKSFLTTPSVPFRKPRSPSKKQEYDHLLDTYFGNYKRNIEEKISLSPWEKPLNERLTTRHKSVKKSLEEIRTSLGLEPKTPKFSPRKMEPGIAYTPKTATGDEKTVYISEKLAKSIKKTREPSKSIWNQTVTTGFSFSSKKLGPTIVSLKNPYLTLYSYSRAFPAKREHSLMRAFPKDKIEEMIIYIKGIKQDEFNYLPQRYIAGLDRLMAAIDRKLASSRYHLP